LPYVLVVLVVYFYGVKVRIINVTTKSFFNDFNLCLTRDRSMGIIKVFKLKTLFVSSDDFELEAAWNAGRPDST
jgi:hypothetical protein